MPVLSQATTSSFPAICRENYSTFVFFVQRILIKVVVVVVDTKRPELNLYLLESRYSSTPLESLGESENGCVASALGDVACSSSPETPTKV